MLSPLKKTALVVAVMSFLLPLALSAQVVFKNSGTARIYVAYASFQLIGGWTTKGWFPIEPGEQQSLYTITALTPPNFYYCARVENSDAGFYGNVAMYADARDAFTIPNAGKQQRFTNPNIIPLKFIQVNLGGRSTYTIEIQPQNLSLNGLPEGKWRIALDKEGDEAVKKEDAEGYREITFSKGRPIGWCKDYYGTGSVRATYKLVSYRPLVLDGKCIWYKPDGSIDKEVTYQSGQQTGSLSYAANGSPIQKKAIYKAIALPVQDFFINSISNARFKGGRHRIVYPLSLPQGTVKWFYEFSAFRNTADLQAGKANFKLAASLLNFADQSGLLSASVGLMGMPPGGDYCNIYAIAKENYQPFLDERPVYYIPESSRLNFRSGIVEVNGSSATNQILGISNESNFYGVNVSIQVVAIVAVTE